MKERHQLGEHRITERLQMEILVDHKFDYQIEPVSSWDHSVTEWIQLGTLLEETSLETLTNTKFSTPT